LRQVLGETGGPLGDPPEIQTEGELKMTTIKRSIPTKCAGNVMIAKPAAWRLRSWWAGRLGGAVTRRLAAAACLALAVVAETVVFLNVPASRVYGQDQAPAQPTFVPTEPVNTPMGVAYGIKPGRVAWAFDPKAATWDGTTNSPGWWDDSNTHPAVVERMLAEAILSVGDAKTVGESWTKIFTDFNKRKGKGDVGYQKGEKIVIKLNLNQVHDHGDGANASYVAPQLVQALLRQLIRQAGVAPADITCYDAIRCVPSTIFDRGTKEFPGVHFVDSTGTDGREKAVPDTTKPLTLSQGNETLFFPTCVTQAAYMINVAGLKGHMMAGMTVCAKNHLGSLLTASGDAGARDMHPSIAVKSGRRGPAPVQAMGSYNGLVDLNGHGQTGGKTVLYLIDALYATKHNEYRLDLSCKWESAPFNKNWTASLFAAQDGVAIDSVALDFLRNEPTLATIVTGAVDNYLHEMAQANQPPSKTVYDPEKNGKRLASLGVHEHWNNAADKQYSRNFGRDTGIELVALNVAPAPVMAASTQ
jgi:uncharacterized protein (DUF362 family)